MNDEIARLRQVIEKITPLIAGRGLRVTQRGTRAYVESDKRTGEIKRVNIPQLPDNSSDALVLSIQGFIDHEVGHVLFTDFKSMSRAVAQMAKEAIKTRPKMSLPDAQKAIQSLWNIAEDLFVERKMQEKFPGAIHNIDRLHGYFIRHITVPLLEKAKDDRGRFGSLLVPAMRALSGQPVFQRFMDETSAWDDKAIAHVRNSLPKPMLARLGKIASTAESMQVARALFEILYPPPPPPPPPAPPSAEPVKEPEKAEKSDSKSSSPSTSKEPGEVDEEGDEDEGQDDGAASDAAGEKPEDDKDEQESKDDAADAETDRGEDERADGDDDDSQDEGDRDGDDEPADEDDAATGDADEPADDDEAAEDDSGSNDADASEDDAPEEDGDDVIEEGEEAADLGEDDDTSAGDGDPGDDDAGDAEAEEGSASEEDGDAEAAVGATAADGEDGDEGGAAGVGEEEAGKDGGFGKGQSEEEAQPGGGNKGGVMMPAGLEAPELEGLDIAAAVMKAISDEALRATYDADYVVFTRDDDKIIPLPQEGDEHDIAQMDEMTRHMVGPMQKDIERLMAARSRAIKVGGFKSGKLNGGALHRVMADDPRVFRRKEEAKVVETAVCLLIDQSGSMHRDKKITVAAGAAYALSQTLERVRVKHEVLGFTTGGSYADQQRILREIDAESAKTGARIAYARFAPLYMPIYKDYDERISGTTRARFAAAFKGGVEMNNNVDGESVEVAARRLMRRTEPRKVLIVLSDGFPAADGYVHGALYRHLKETVEATEKAGIEVIGIGIQSDSVKQFYPKNIVLNKVEDLPKAVMGELKKILMK